MKYGIYRRNPYIAGGAYREIKRGGKLVAFATKREANEWIESNNIVLKGKHTTIGVRRVIKEVK